MKRLSLIGLGVLAVLLLAVPAMAQQEPPWFNDEIMPVYKHMVVRSLLI